MAMPIFFIHCLIINPRQNHITHPISLKATRILPRFHEILKQMNYLRDQIYEMTVFLLLIAQIVLIDEKTLIN